jgi:hypothetical protein
MDQRPKTTTRAALAIVAVLIAFSSLTAAATTPVAPPASPAPPSVRDSPGYVPLHDPDSLDEILGRRRNAPRVKMEFQGGSPSLDELGRSVCRALHTTVPDSMLALCVKSDEFRVILWPEFPQSRPATGLRWDDAWPILWGRLNGGSVSSVREFQDHYHQFIKLEYAAMVPYRNFRLYNGITITAKDDEGRIEKFTFIRSIAERKGRFKIYSMRD